jgi:ATP-dependent Lon protease
VEASLMSGKKGLLLTGQLGDVMKESAQAALTYLRSNAEAFGVDTDFDERSDIHIHVPAGAIPKDGPSAGVTILSALTSALTGRALRSKLAMTGEITLRGAVLPVGGIKEKVLAARRAGVNEIILPERNRKDVEEIEAELVAGLTFSYVEQASDVLNSALDSAQDEPMPSKPAR